jgi:hypothetical protein
MGINPVFIRQIDQHGLKRAITAFIQLLCGKTVSTSGAFPIRLLQREVFPNSRFAD